jgi:hypothetical protein
MKGSASLIFAPSAPEAAGTGRLSAASLRSAKPLTIWGGRGCGVPCDFCHSLLSASDVEYEVDARLDNERVTLHFHHRCYETWKTDRETE